MESASSGSMTKLWCLSTKTDLMLQANLVSQYQVDKR